MCYNDKITSKHVFCILEFSEKKKNGDGYWNHSSLNALIYLYLVLKKEFNKTK